MQFFIECVDPNGERAKAIRTFYAFVCDTLGIVGGPKVNFTPNLNTASFGLYSPSDDIVTVAVEGRHISDILRTFAHELVHHVQLTNSTDPSDRSLEDLEYEANAVAGMLMRDYNKLHPEMFGLHNHEDVPPEGFPESQGPVADDTTRPSQPIELAELSNETMATYKRAAKGELRSVRRIDKDGMPFGYRIDYLHNRNKYENRRKGIKTAEKKLEARYAPVQEEMTAGAGDVAGIGIGPQGEPGVYPRKKKFQILKPMVRRKKTFKQFMRGE